MTHHWAGCSTQTWLLTSLPPHNSPRHPLKKFTRSLLLRGLLTCHNRLHKQTNTQSHVSANKKKKKTLWDWAEGGTILFHISQEQIESHFPSAGFVNLSSSPRGASSPFLFRHHHLWICVIFLHYLFKLVNKASRIWRPYGAKKALGEMWIWAYLWLGMHRPVWSAQACMCGIFQQVQLDGNWQKGSRAPTLPVTHHRSAVQLQAWNHVTHDVDEINKPTMN